MESHLPTIENKTSPIEDTSQGNRRSLKIGRWFSYIFMFALLGLVTDIPFEVFDWQDRRMRVLLRLAIWWFPRLVMFAFVANPPVLRDLDPAMTALTVLAIDGLLAAFFLWLHTSRRQTS